MDDRIDHGFEQRSFAVLGQVDACGILARANEHVPDRKCYRLTDLAVQRAGDLLRVDLTGGAIAALVARGSDAGAWQPAFGIHRAEQHTGDGRPRDGGLVGREERQPHEPCLGVNRPFRAQQRLPECRIRSRGRSVHRTIGDFNQQDQLPVAEFGVVCANANGRLDRVGADLYQQIVQEHDLLPRHSRHVATVGDATNQHPAVRVGERRDFVRQVIAARAPWPAAGEVHLLEFPLAILADPQSADDLLAAVAHRIPSHADRPAGLPCFLLDCFAPFRSMEVELPAEAYRVPRCPPICRRPSGTRARSVDPAARKCQ